MPPRRLERRPSLESLVERVDQQRPGEISGDTVPTGFPSLDQIRGGGVRRRDLVVLGGDVGSCKSALALGIALRVAQQEGGVGVAFFSGEMDEERLMERALAVEGRVAVDELRAAKLSDQTRAGVGGAAVRLRGLPLAILPLAAADFETLTARLGLSSCRRWRRAGQVLARPRGAGALAGAGGVPRRVYVAPGPPLFRRNVIHSGFPRRSA